MKLTALRATFCSTPLVQYKFPKIFAWLRFSWGVKSTPGTSALTCDWINSWAMWFNHFRNSFNFRVDIACMVSSGSSTYFVFHDAFYGNDFFHIFRMILYSSSSNIPKTFHRRQTGAPGNKSTSTYYRVLNQNNVQQSLFFDPKCLEMSRLVLSCLDLTHCVLRHLILSSRDKN